MLWMKFTHSKECLFEIEIFYKGFTVTFDQLNKKLLFFKLTDPKHIKSSVYN